MLARSFLTLNRFRPWTEISHPNRTTQALRNICRKRFNSQIPSGPATATKIESTLPPPPPLPKSSASSFASVVKLPGCAAQIIFCLATSSFGLYFAATYASIDTALLEKEFKEIHESQASTMDLHRIRTTILVKKLREYYTNIQESVSKGPEIVKAMTSAVTLGLFQPYANATEGKRICWKISMLYTSIWLLTKLSPRFFSVYGRHSPLSGRSLTLLSSTFTHFSFIHLLMSCFALDGFGSSAYYFLINSQTTQESHRLESTATPHFLAFFVSAALFSSLFSHIIRAKIVYPRAVSSITSNINSSLHSSRLGTWAVAMSEFSSKQPKSLLSRLFGFSSKQTSNGATSKSSLSRLATVGASGPIIACFTMTAMAFPEAEVALYIPPTYPINIGWFLSGFLSIDIIGALRGWTLLNHHAHLGGYLFGYIYWKYGPSLWEWLRQDIDEQVKVIVYT